MSQHRRARLSRRLEVESLEDRSLLSGSPLNFSPLGTHESGIFAPGSATPKGAEISAHDPISQRLFVVNSVDQTIDILSISDPTNPTVVDTFDVTPFGNQANSVATKNGIIAVAIEAVNKQANGVVVFINANGDFLKQVPVGALPDMLTFTPDGLKVVVANEGEPNSYNQIDSVDPEGSVSIIDLSAGVGNATVQTAAFTAFNGQLATLQGQGVRIFGPNATVAQDLEPEYIAISPDSTTAYVTLQENNAFATVNLATATVTSLESFGLKDFSQFSAELETFTFDQAELGLAGLTPAGQEVDFGGFSGLFFEGYTDDGKYRFIAHTDRGPNGVNSGINRPFLIPTFNPQLVRFTLDPFTGRLEIVERIGLKDSLGNPLTGLPNINLAGGTTSTPYQDEIPVDLTNAVLGLDPLGGDFEGIAVDTDGSFWMVDEYRPAIYHFEADGDLIDRFIPTGTAAAAGQPLGTFGTEVLPAVLAQRRLNRGFEAIALDAANNKLYAFVQSPIRNPTSLGNAALDGMQNIRIVEFDTATEQVTRTFLYIMDNAAPVSGTDSRADKIGDAAFIGNGEFLVVERDDDALDSDPAADIQKKIYRFNLSAATDVTGMDGLFDVGGGVMKSIDQMTAAELAGQGITPIAKNLHIDLNTLGYNTVEKVEGLAFVDGDTLAVVNDNDFGVAGITINTTDGTFTPDPNKEPVVVGLINTFNGLDPSDRDNAAGTGPAVQIVNRPVFGMYMPDTIASFTIGGQTYIVTANEGDAREYTGYVEELRVGSGDYDLDPAVFTDPTIEQNRNLGRLTVSTATGNTDGDADFEQIHMFGARSFSIWTAAGDLIYDSGDDFEQFIAANLPTAFNVNNENNTLDNRSDDKGPEPEGLTLATLNGRVYAFIGLERHSGVMVYDVTDPTSPLFVDYVLRRDFTQDPAIPAQLSAAGDLGPEGVLFIAATDSPTGNALMVTTNETSGTVTLYEITESDRTFNVPAGDGSDQLVLRKNGADLELFDAIAQEVIFSQPLVDTNSLAIVGVAGEPDSLTVDFAFGGAFTLPGGLSFDGGLGQGLDNFGVIGTGGDDTFTVNDSNIVITSDLLTLNATVQNAEQLSFNGGGGEDLYALNRTQTAFRIQDTGGIDTFDFSAMTTSVEVRLNRSSNQLQNIRGGNTLRLQGTVENLTATAFNDEIVGNSASNILRGGGGNDDIHAGGGGDLVLGEAGDDDLHGQGGLDVLLGGLGADLILGGEKSDLLIGSPTTFDNVPATLLAVLAEWTSGNDYLTRINNLLPTLSGALQPDDATDVLQGNGGRDWFFASGFDQLLDRKNNERLN